MNFLLQKSLPLVGIFLLFQTFAEASANEFLTIRGACLSIERAETPEQKETGLMFRRELAADHGMLFPFHPPRRASMWMKNTYIPLDMLFLDAQGRVVHLAENTQPLSETPIASPHPVSYVLEVPGGTARRLGIQLGDTAIMGETKCD